MSRRSEKGRQPARRLVVGFVCEGSTDIVVLRRVVEQVLGDIDARALQPEIDALDRQLPGGQSGWSEVRAWCQRVQTLDEYFEPDVGDPLDLMVLAVDLDIAIRAGLTKLPENLSAYDATDLCRVIKSWLPQPLPGRVLIAIPVMSTETWLLAALFPRMRNLEAEKTPAQVLVDKGKMTMGRNGPWKRASEYRVFAETVASKLKRVRDACGEADRFVKKLEGVASRIAP